MAIYAFLRNDDVYRIDGRFLEFHDIIVREEVPATYAVIPGRLDNRCISFLREECSRRPGMLDISQHGWMHRNYGEDIKYEFGNSRTYSQQKRDISRGREVIMKSFAQYANNIFVPPYHHMNKDTFRVIREAGFEGVSVPYGSIILKDQNIINLPVHIKLDDIQPERYSETIRQIFRWSKRDDVIGILTHHEKIENMKSFERILKFIKAMEKKGIITFANFTKILEAKRNAPEKRNL